MFFVSSLLAFKFMIQAASAQVDLHAHFIMKPGVGLLLQGTFNETPKASTYRSRFKTKATESSLLSPDLPKIMVVSLYAHPWLPHPFHFNPIENIRSELNEEYDILQEFIHRHSDRFVLAKTANEARSALHNGKTIFVLSLEGAHGALETEADLNQWVDERGLAILTPFHLTEDDFGGTAFLSGVIGFLNSPLAFLESILLSGGDCLKSFCSSPVGLKPKGLSLIESAMKKKVWIDFSHSNDIESAELLLMMSATRKPLLVTHTFSREILPAERGIRESELQYLQKYGGIIGLMPSDDYLPPRSKTAKCHSGITMLREEVKRLALKIGPEKVTLGSDINAPLQGLSPECDSPETDGFYRYEQIHPLMNSIAPISDWDSKTTEAFLAAWEKIRP
jgi:microsomal dipeptidase-like Zn-dependent dipeptidase